jgi:inorganic pyrophosphatase
MPSPISELSTFGEQDAVRVVIETPAGSRLKFEPKSGVFTMHKALAQGFFYPFPFGFIPRTEGSDGDPIDVLLITTLEPPENGRGNQARRCGQLLDD